MKKTLAILFACCIVVIALMLMRPARLDSEAAVATAKAYFYAVKALDYDKAYTYVYPTKMENKLPDLDRSELELLKTFMERTSFKVLHVTETTKGYEVTIELTVPDLAWCLKAAISKTSPKTRGDYLILLVNKSHKIMKHGVPMETVTQDLLVKKRHGKMMIMNYDKNLPLIEPRLIKPELAISGS